jgi:hypothetical protein
MKLAFAETNPKVIIAATTNPTAVLFMSVLLLEFRLHRSIKTELR